MRALTVILIFSLLLLLPTKVISQNVGGAGSPIGNAAQDRSFKTLFFQVPADSVPYEKEPTVIKKVDPIYPKKALKDSLEGDVLVKVRVNARGDVVNARVIRTDDDIFNEAALTAARQWKFTPAVLKGEPVAVWVSIPFRFRLKH
jgi:TonB family protein